MELHHPLVKEFPEHREIIKHLRASDDNFRKMYEEYHNLDDTICRLEEDVDFGTDQEIEELKMRRVWLKNHLYTTLRHSAPVVQ
jgi:uncharacterized protein YdcH (DUF465 family)